MRKLVVSMNVTLDGFMSGSAYELNWHFENWSSDMAESLSQELARADTIVLGRLTYDAMAAYWPAQSNCLDVPRTDIAFADMMNNHTKLVFSKRMSRADWRNSTIMSGDVAEEVARLKNLKGKNLIVFGSGTLVKSLLQLNLIDEYLLWIHPVLLADGITLFKDHHKKNLLLLDGRTFQSGVVALRYQSEIPNTEYPTPNT